MPISIFDIRPDDTQPRRVCPNAVMLDAGFLGPIATFPTWLAMCESGEDSSHWVDALLAGKDADVPEHPGPIEAALIGVLHLALSIKRSGLANPITVVKEQGGYVIETGERRWWAYQALYDFHSGDEQWAKIPARVVDRFDRFRQASENTARGDLNMIAKTRQWALLLMTQHEATETFIPYESVRSDRDFYAQVAGLHASDGAVIRNACGVTSDAALSHYRKALGLSPEQWLQADDEGWSRQQIEGGLTTVKPPSVEQETRDMSSVPKTAAKKSSGRQRERHAKAYATIKSADEKVAKWDADKCQQALLEVDALREWSEKVTMKIYKRMAEFGVDIVDAQGGGAPEPEYSDDLD